MKYCLLIFLSLSIVSPTFAKKERQKYKDKMQKIFQQLNLSEEQQKKLKKIQASRKDKMKSLLQEKKETKKAFKEAMKSNTLESTLKRHHKKMLQANTNFKKYKFKTLLKKRSLLNDSQKKKFIQLHRKKHNKSND